MFTCNVLQTAVSADLGFPSAFDNEGGEVYDGGKLDSIHIVQN